MFRIKPKTKNIMDRYSRENLTNAKDGPGRMAAPIHSNKKIISQI